MASFDYFAFAGRLEQGGEPFATATVVRVERPTSGKPGDRAIVTVDGELHGWIGGSCAKPTVVKEAMACLREGRSRLIRLSSEPDERQLREGITDLSMTCFSGGTMEIFVEPHPPRPRLIVVGDQPIAQALSTLGKAMCYQVVAVGTAELDHADESIDSASDIVQNAHPLTSVVVATHGEQDEITVEYALESSAAYVGLVSSPKRAGSIRSYLEKRGISADRLSALRAPAGLDIQAREPEEIALSILAEIVQVLRSGESFEWPQKTAGATEEKPSTPASETAVDPVCGMTVDIATSQHVHHHAGESYYFCCSGCLARFSSEPELFVSARA